MGVFGQHSAGYFPPGTTYEARQYDAYVYEETRYGESRVWIRVEDAQGSRLLNDPIGPVEAPIVVGRVTWTDFDNLEVRLYEVIDDGNSDYQNVAIEPRPPHAKFLMRLVYRYDAASKQFIRVRALTS
jgi:hypothetical protein